MADFRAPKLPDFHRVARFGPEYPQKLPIWRFLPIFGKKKSETSGDAVKTEHRIPGRPVICALAQKDYDEPNEWDFNSTNVETEGTFCDFENPILPSLFCL